MSMDSPLSNNGLDEVIADSEDDMVVMENFSAQNDISAFPSLNPYDARPKGISSISDFTANLTLTKAQDDYSLANDSIASGEPCSIADRAKTRRRTQPKTKTPSYDGNIIELTSEDDEGLSPKQASQSKLKRKAKSTGKQSPPNASTTAISPVTTVAHNSARPRPRPRPRPRLITKQVRAQLDSDPLPPHPYPFARNPLQYEMPVVSPLPASTPPSLYQHEPDLPVATSPADFNPRGPVSQLPPSDPPNPTVSTASEEERFQPQGLPPIEILQGEESDRDRASTPQFSNRSRRKKRGIDKGAVVDDEIDQLLSSPSRAAATSHPNIPIDDAYTRRRHEEVQDMPPPTFFAGSSSSSTTKNDVPQEPGVTSQPQFEVVDLTDLPPTLDLAVTAQDTSSTSKKPHKPRMQKNKKVTMYPNFDLGREPMVGLDDDDDFDPQEDKTPKKTKGKRKAKELPKKRPKEKKAKVTKTKEQLEVVIVRPKSKSKGKVKEKQSEESFKSREFIQDSDEGDDDPLRLVGSMEEEERIVTTEPKLGAVAALVSSTPDPDLEPANASATSKSKTPTAPKEKAKARGKKRKSIQESDHENERNIDGQEKSIIAKKKGRSKNDQQELSQAILSGEEGGENGSDGATRPDADKGQQDHMQRNLSTVDEDKNVKKVEKENVIQTTAPVSKMAPSASRAPTVDPDCSTPLYARYEVAPRRSSLPMTELIRRASSKPSSPFPGPASTPTVKDRYQNKKHRIDAESPAPSTPITTAAAYSPYLKSSRRLLSRIAPLHPNRKEPPPPPPPPPPKKKTKKELEMEERWEEELVDSVGGIDVWASMEESERKDMRRAKREVELGGYED